MLTYFYAPAIHLHPLVCLLQNIHHLIQNANTPNTAVLPLQFH